MSYLGAGLGAAAITDPRIEFQTKYTALEFQVQLAFQQMLAKSPPAGVVTTMSNNIQSMQRLAQRALAGETAKMVDVSRVGEAIIRDSRRVDLTGIAVRAPEGGLPDADFHIELWLVASDP